MEGKEGDLSHFYQLFFLFPSLSLFLFMYNETLLAIMSQTLSRIRAALSHSNRTRAD